MTTEHPEPAPLGAAVVTPGTSALVLTTYPPTVYITNRLWTRWAAIAVRHERFARDARAWLEREKAAGRQLTLDRELEPAMVAIAAAAHALDALYAGYREQVPAEMREACRKNRTSRVGRVFETLKRAGTLAEDLHAEFTWLFALRDGAVHHGEKMEETMPHPSKLLGTAVGPEYAYYTTEGATRAVDLVLRVFEAVATRRNDLVVRDALQSLRGERIRL